MSNTLQENLNKILEDKNTNLLTSNLKKNITCLGVNGELEEVNNEDITITPTMEEQIITHDEDYTGIGNVTVEAVTSDIDTNITSDNIKEGISILGVQGTLQEVNNQDLEVTKNGAYTAEDGYTGLGTVTVNVEGGSSTYNGRIYNTYDEMVADVDNINDGDICLVYNTANIVGTDNIINPWLIFPETIPDTSNGKSGNIFTLGLQIISTGVVEVEASFTRDSSGDISSDWFTVYGSGYRDITYKNLTRYGSGTGSYNIFADILSYWSDLDPVNTYTATSYQVTFTAADTSDEIWDYIKVINPTDFVLYTYDNVRNIFHKLPDTYTITASTVLSGYKGYHEGVITGTKDLSTTINLGRIPVLYVDSNYSIKPSGKYFYQYDVTDAPSYGDSRYVYAYQNER